MNNDSIFNRDFYTADGRDWFEPRQDELEEEFSDQITLAEAQNCTYCDKRLAPGTKVWLHKVKKRTWLQDGGISGKFSDWSFPEIVGVGCIEDCIEIPY
jgi:hypothetical protein